MKRCTWAEKGTFNSSLNKFKQSNAYISLPLKPAGSGGSRKYTLIQNAHKKQWELKINTKSKTTQTNMQRTYRNSVTIDIIPCTLVTEIHK